MDFAPGEVLLGKYRVERVVGRGAMGVVVCAEHLVLKERVALKVMILDESLDSRFAARFQREAELMAKLRGEHAVRVHDVGRLAGGQPFIAMEYLDGRDLRGVVRDGPLSVDAAVGLVLQACEGVAEAHARGIVHRDLKPTNLLLTTRSDGQALIKVLDYGVSKPPKSDDEISQVLTGNSSVLGSPRYMSPEQLRTPHDVDARADVWALASILQELITGRAPFDGPTTAALCAAIIDSPPTPLRRLKPDAPAELEDAILRALDKDREARTQSVAALADDLVVAVGSPAALRSTVLRIERILAPTSTAFTRTGPGSPKRVRSSRDVSIAALVVGVCAAVVGGILLTRSPAPHPVPAPSVASSAPSPASAPSDPPPSASASPPTIASSPPATVSIIPTRRVPGPAARRDPDVPQPPPVAPPEPPKRNPLDDRH